MNGDSVGDNDMLVTLWWRQLWDISNFIFAMKSLCHILNLSPKHFVYNTRHQNRRYRISMSFDVKILETFSWQECLNLPLQQQICHQFAPRWSFVTNTNVVDIIDLGLIQLSSDSEESTNKSYKIKRYNLFRHLGNLFNPAGY